MTFLELHFRPGNCLPGISQTLICRRLIEFMIDEEFLSGVIVRSKELWVEQGEKPTKYFFNLEKKGSRRKR